MPRFRPMLEVLEDRLALSGISTLTVTNNSDTGVSGDGSLRGEIAAASSGDTIVFAANLAGQTIKLTSGELLINTNLTIQGLGANQLAVSGNKAGRVFDIGANGNVTISGLTIENGKAPVNLRFPTGQGGGIFNAGTLMLNNCDVRSNTAGGVVSPGNGNNGGSGQGGGLYSLGGTVTLNNDTFSNNVAAGGSGGVAISVSSRGGTGGNGQGGGIYVATGTLNLTNDTFANNNARGGNGGGGALGVGGAGGNGEGGGLYNAGATLTLTNDTIAGNQTLSGSGGFSRGGSGSNGSVAGGGIVNVDGTINLRNTLVATNTASGSPDVAGSVTSNGHNLLGDGTGSSGITNGTNGDQVGSSASPINPKLGSLQNNGGSTPTMALLAGSPALDAGDSSAVFVTGPFDQRGPGFNRISNGTIDIGAFEFQVAAPPSPPPSPAPSTLPSGKTFTELLFLAEDQLALSLDEAFATMSNNPLLTQAADGILIALNNLMGLVNPALGTGLAGLQAAINANPLFGTPMGDLAQADALEVANILLSGNQ
jgi:hypothetical protein